MVNFINKTTENKTKQQIVKEEEKQRKPEKYLTYHKGIFFIQKERPITDQELLKILLQ
jgi:hypothetical protein